MPDGVHFSATYDRLFNHDLDALFVCLPNDLAAEATIAGLEHGMHVFCEKPPGRTMEDIQRVIEWSGGTPGSSSSRGSTTGITNPCERPSA